MSPFQSTTRMTDGIKGAWEYPTRGSVAIQFTEDDQQVDELTSSELAMIDRVLSGRQEGPAAFRLA